MTEPENLYDEIRYLVEFGCGHSRIFPEPAPLVGEILWCPQCKSDGEVVSAPPRWRIRCEDCGYNPPAFGAAKIAGEIAAAKHRMRSPGHVVRIYNGRKHVRSFGERDLPVIESSPRCDPAIGF